MKNSSAGWVLLLTTALCCLALPAAATQGVYGTIYADTDVDGFGNPKPDSQSRTVANAVIYVYNSNYQYVTQTTATICGYYSVEVPSSGTYDFMVVSSTYYLRMYNSCSTVDRTDFVGNDRWRTISTGWWYQLDIPTF